MNNAGRLPPAKCELYPIKLFTTCVHLLLMSQTINKRNFVNVYNTVLWVSQRCTECSEMNFIAVEIVVEAKLN